MKVSPDFDPVSRQAAWELLVNKCESYLSQSGQLRVTPRLDPDAIRTLAGRFDFETPMGFADALDHVIQGLSEHQVHTPHPGYFGLFNPRPVFPGIAGELVAAAYNPQLAAWSHSPFANEVEIHLVREIGKQFGYPGEQIDGNFTYGGGESNFTALLCALNHHFPEYATQGLSGIPENPVFYASAESHHSFLKAARMAGMGTDHLRMVPVEKPYAMSSSDLSDMIRADQAKGFHPFMVASTAGTTGAGVFDPLDEIQTVCDTHHLWHHVDAAYGGGGILLPELRKWYKGIERSDSLIFDAHKWLSVPMAGSLFITRHPEILSRTFRTTADYMPKEAEGMGIEDPFAHSLQWSRRFTGLKLYLALLVFGWEGYRDILRHQVQMGALLRKKLLSAGWKVYNDTPLPVILFGHPSNETAEFVRQACNQVLQAGRSWISVYTLQGQATLRACITNYRTEEEDLDQLMEGLDNIISDG